MQPASRRVHKVREGLYAASGYPLRQSTVRHSEWFGVSSRSFENPLDHKTKSDEPEDLFVIGEPDVKSGTSVLGRRSYIDDILVPAESWDSLCNKVERLLDVCDCWNLSISAVKSSWGCRKVDYLGHRVSSDGLEAHPKDLQSLVDLPLPTTLKAMQSFLGSLNYYGRFIEDYAIYASILYELREVDFHAWRCRWENKDEVKTTEKKDEKWSRV